MSTGEASSDDDAASKAQMEKTEISLTLSNKFEVPEHEQSDVHSQLIRLVPHLGSVTLHQFQVHTNSSLSYKIPISILIINSITK